MAPTAAWRPIGHVLVEAGAISQEDLELALIEQRRSGRRLGEILIDSGRITWLQLANAIADQANDLDGGAEPPPEEVPEPVEAVEPVTVVEAVEPVAPPVAAPVVAPVEAVAAVETVEAVEVVEPAEVAEPPVVAPVPVAEPPVSRFAAPPVSEPSSPASVTVIHSDDAVTRLETVEAMLKERQRAFLELVSVTERLRATVAKLQDELDQRNAEIMKLRNRSVSAA